MTRNVFKPLQAAKFIERARRHVNLESLTRELSRLSTADAVVIDSYVRHLLTKSALWIFAGIVAGVGLVLLELSGYWLLERSIGAVAAAATLGLLSCVLAAVILLAAALQRPGREFFYALDVRRSAIQSLEQEIPSGQSHLAPSGYPMSEALVSAVIMPLLFTLIRSFKATKAEKTELTTTTPPPA